MSQPPEDIRFDSGHILASYPVHRVVESAGSNGSGQQNRERRRQPSGHDDSQEEEPDPQDIVEVSGDYQAVVSSAPVPPISRPTVKTTAKIRTAVPAPTPELHLDIKA